MKKYHQTILLEFRNTEPFVYKVVSDKVITIERVVKFFKDREDFNEERDGITFVDDVSELNID